MKHQPKLINKNIIISAAADGIGWCIAEFCLNEGANVYLSDNKIGDEGCRHLAPALTEMKGLDRFEMYLNNIGDEGAKELAEALKVNTSLEKINLEENDIGDEGVKELAEGLKEAPWILQKKLLLKDIIL